MPSTFRRRSGFLVSLLALLVLLPAFATVGAARPATTTAAQPALDCRPLLERNPEVGPPEGEIPPPPPAGPPAAERTEVTVGFVPASLYAPVFVAEGLGYFDEYGLDVTLEPLAGGSDLIALTASGQLDIAAVGAGPAFWNAIALDLPVTVIAPGHQEGSPVLTPLMISKDACESGAITSVADLEGKRVAVNAPGGTEFWLGQALAQGGLTLADVDQQFLAFPDAVAALASGAIDAAMIGEPLATQAELDGLAVRLLPDFPVQGIQPTTIIGNDGFLADNPEAAAGFATAYLKASRYLNGPGFVHPSVLAIVEETTGVPADLVRQAVRPVYQEDGEIDLAGLAQLQEFFRERGQLEFDDPIDPATVVDTTYIDQARAALGPADAATPAT